MPLAMRFCFARPRAKRLYPGSRLAGGFREAEPALFVR
jgi:hypothetical protein